MFSSVVVATQTSVTFSLTVIANEWKPFRSSQKAVVPLNIWFD